MSGFSILSGKAGSGYKKHLKELVFQAVTSDEGNNVVYLTDAQLPCHVQAELYDYCEKSDTKAVNQFKPLHVTGGLDLDSAYRAIFDGSAMKDLKLFIDISDKENLKEILEFTEAVPQLSHIKLVVAKQLQEGMSSDIFRLFDTDTPYKELGII